MSDNIIDVRDSNEFIGPKSLDTVWSQAKAKFFVKTGSDVDHTLLAISNIGKNPNTEVIGILRKTTTDTWAIDHTEYVRGITADSTGIHFDKASATGGNGEKVTLSRLALRKTLNTDSESTDELAKLITLDPTTNKLRVSEIPDFILGQIVYGGTISWGNNVCTAHLSPNGKSKLKVSGETITIVNSATGTGGSKGWTDCDGLFFISVFDAPDGSWMKDIGSQSDNKGIMKGDWLVPVVGSWDKVDNTDAVTGISIGDYDGATHITKLGTVVIDADVIHALSTTKTTRQTMKSTLYTEGALEAEQGVSAHGIHDLEQAGIGGGGAGGVSIVDDWNEVDESNPTQVVSSKLSKQTKTGVDNLEDELNGEGGIDDRLTGVENKFEGDKAKKAKYADDADKLDGHDSTYFATSQALAEEANARQTAINALEGYFEDGKAKDAKVADKVANKLTTKNGDIVTKTFDGSVNVAISKDDLGLGNVDNTSDADKPISTATQTALNTITTNLNNEVNARKGADLTGVEIGEIKTRGSNPTTPAVKFKHTNGSIDIARGTEVDIIASNLVGDALPQTDQMFAYRTTAGDASIKPTGTAHIDKLSGNTIVWNQLVNINESQPSSVTSHSNISTSNGVMKLTSKDGAFGRPIFYTAASSAHSYLTIAKIKTTANNFVFQYAYRTNTGVVRDVVPVFTMEANRLYEIVQFLPRVDFTSIELGAWQGAGIYGNVGDVFEAQIVLHDLTQMFGDDASICKALGVANLTDSANQTKAIANFKALFPQSYYPYNAGELVSFGGEGVELETIGRNLWDEEWEHGYFDDTTGAFIADDIVIRSKNFIRVMPGQKLVSSNSLVHALYFFDSNGGYISLVPTMGNPSITVPPNATFCKFRCVRAYGGTYNHDICISLAWSGSRTGYEPYSRHTLPVTPYIPEEFKKKAYNLGDLVLHEGAMYKRTASGGVKKDWADADWTMIRCAGGGIGQALSAGSVHDEYYEDHCVIRVGSMDLGELIWDYSKAPVRFVAAMPNNAQIDSSYTTKRAAVCDRYEWLNGAKLANETNPGYSYYVEGSNRLFVKDIRYTNSSDFKEAVLGVKLYYELADPITIWYDTKQNFDYFADDYGTEGWIPQTSGTPMFVPPYINITYGINVVDEVRTLPSKYATKKELADVASSIPDVQLEPEYTEEEVTGFTLIVNDEEITMSEMSEETVMRICSLD